MRTLIFGAGAMGSFIGGLFAQEHDVTFIGRQAHMNAIRKTGLEITGKTELKLPEDVIHTYEDVEPVKKEGNPPELVLVTVKSYDTQNILTPLKEIIGPDTILLSLQNGLDNEELLRQSFPSNIVLGSTICHGITHTAPGKIYHAGFGDTVIGSFKTEENDAAREISKIFREMGIENQLTNNICGELWIKVAINASINPLTAITGLKNGWLLREPGLESLLEETCAEVINVAKTSGAKLPTGPEGDILARTKHVVERTADNKSSMLQDIEKGRRTEIDSINGAVCRVGDKYGVSTPVNNTLTTLVKGLEIQMLAKK